MCRTAKGGWITESWRGKARPSDRSNHSRANWVSPVVEPTIFRPYRIAQGQEARRPRDAPNYIIKVPKAERDAEE